MYLFLSVSGAVILSLLLIFVLISYISYRYVFGRNEKREPMLFKGLDGELPPEKQRKRELIEALAALPFEDVYITGEDGVRLYARYYPGEIGAPVAIGFHGYRSSSLRDLAGLACDYIARGFGVLLVDERAHGRSGGRSITFGAKESRDVLLWARYAEERFGKETKAIIFGMSMGAAAVIMASALDLPGNVVGAVADCPFSAVKDILMKVCRDRGIPAGLSYPAIAVGARLFGGFSLGKEDPINAIKSAQIPIFLVHGSGDSFVPHEMSDELASVGQTVTYLKVKDAPHLLAMMCDEAGYTAAHSDFIDKLLYKESK